MKTREPLIVIIQQNGIETRRRTEPSRVIYKCRDGTEEVSFLGGYRNITRDEQGRAVLTINYISVPTKTIQDLTAKLQGNAR